MTVHFEALDRPNWFKAAHFWEPRSTVIEIAYISGWLWTSIDFSLPSSDSRTQDGKARMSTDDGLPSEDPPTNVVGQE